MDYEDFELLRTIASCLESDWQMSGLSDGLYFEWAAEVAVRFHAAKVSANAELTGPRLFGDIGLNAGLGFPPILDACCGGKMFWWNKDNPDALFIDCREVEKGAFQNNWNPGWCVKPDEIADFRDMPFPDNVFKMVVFDPPHLTSGSMKSVINKKYGLLNKETWKSDIVSGFTECWRVLAPGGTLIFKWNEANIKAKDLLRSFPVEPLFGDFTGKTGSTIWVTYMKPNA